MSAGPGHAVISLATRGLARVCGLVAHKHLYEVQRVPLRFHNA